VSFLQEVRNTQAASSLGAGTLAKASFNASGEPGGGSAASSMAAPCHGAAGLAHLYDRLHQATGEAERRLT